MLGACLVPSFLALFLYTTPSISVALQKRDAPLVTVNIPLTVNKDQRYVAGVNMSTSADTQKFKFAMVANTGYSAVAGIACDDCNNVPAYNPSLSASQTSFPGSKNLTIGNSSINGTFIKEDCGLQEVNGSSWLYINQTIIVANSSTLFSDVTSGLIGLGTNANGQSGDFDDTVFGGWLIRNPTRNNFSFGMALQAPDFTSDDDLGNGGILHWVVPDSSAYEGDIVWNNASVAPTAPDDPSGNDSSSIFGLPEADWRIAMDGWSASVGSSALSRAPSNAFAIVEPFYPNIYFPESEATALYGTIDDAAKLDNLVNGAQTWRIPCDTDLTISFTFQGTDFIVGSDRLINNQGGTCTGTVQAFSDPNVTNFILGGIRDLSYELNVSYSIIVVGRPGSGIPNSIGIAQRATHSKKPIGAIVGGVVGGVIGLALLMGAAFYLGRRYGRKRTSGDPQSFASTSEKDSPDKSDVQYAKRSYLSDRTLSKSSLPTPPSSFTNASFRPLLPEAHSPQSPAFSGLPFTPASPVIGVPPVTPVSSTELGNSMISYNNAALSANIRTSVASSDHDQRSTVTSGSEPSQVITPYILPTQPYTPSSQSGVSSVRDVKSWYPIEEERLVSMSSLRNIDPLSPSSGAATVEPFILGPVPSTARIHRGDSKDSKPPPYASYLSVPDSRMNSIRSPASATLIEYAPTTNMGSQSGRILPQPPSS